MTDDVLSPEKPPWDDDEVGKLSMKELIQEAKGIINSLIPTLKGQNHVVAQKNLTKENSEILTELHRRLVEIKKITLPDYSIKTLEDAGKLNRMLVEYQQQDKLSPSVRQRISLDSAGKISVKEHELEFFSKVKDSLNELEQENGKLIIEEMDLIEVLKKDFEEKILFPELKEEFKKTGTITIALGAIPYVGNLLNCVRKINDHDHEKALDALEDFVLSLIPAGQKAKGFLDIVETAKKNYHGDIGKETMQKEFKKIITEASELYPYLRLAKKLAEKLGLKKYE